MDLRHFRYFVVVAEELHFGRAAERLHIAQPALSIQIKKIEDQLGGNLFNRTSRSVTLTEAGEIFLKEAKLALQYAERAEQTAKEALQGNLGKINIAYSGSVTYSGLLGRNIQSFRQHKPDIEIHLYEADPFTQLELLMKGDADIGFLTTFSLDIPEDISVVSLAHWPLCIAMPAEHPLSNKDKIDIEKLKDDCFISYAHSPNDDGTGVIRKLVSFEPNVSYRKSNIMSILAMVDSGMGVSIVPNILEQTLNLPGLIFKELTVNKFYIDISVAYVNQNPKSTTLAFIEHIQKQNDQKIVRT